MPSEHTTSTGASSGTVSRWAQKSTVGAPSGASIRANRLPASEPVSPPLRSSTGSRPAPRSAAATASAIGRSRREGLSISQRRANSSSMRSFSSRDARGVAATVTGLGLPIPAGARPAGHAFVVTRVSSSAAGTAAGTGSAAGALQRRRPVGALPVPTTRWSTRGRAAMNPSA